MYMSQERCSFTQVFFVLVIRIRLEWNVFCCVVDFFLKSLRSKMDADHVGNKTGHENEKNNEKNNERDKNSSLMQFIKLSESISDQIQRR